MIDCTDMVCQSNQHQGYKHFIYNENSKQANLTEPSVNIDLKCLLLFNYVLQANCLIYIALLYIFLLFAYLASIYASFCKMAFF